MHRLQHLIRAFAAHFNIVRDWRLAALLGGLFILLAAAAQTPRTYSIPIGRADGPGSDLPLVSGYYGAERDPRGSFRWSGARSSVDLPGTGQRALNVTLRVLPLGDVAPRAPKELELWSDGRKVAVLPVRPNGATYYVRVPAPADRSGDQQIELRSATFAAGDPPRALGVPVDDVVATGDGFALPAWRSTLVWLLAALMLWVAVRLAGFAARPALALLAPLALLIGLAAALDPPRTAMGAWPALLALTLGALLVAALRVAVPRLAVRLNVPLDARALRWLLLVVLAVFAMRYGGKIYPLSMEGDIGFHTNRFTDVVEGKVMLLSKNRGVFFPYPPALYLLLAPWTLAGFSRPELLHLVPALMDAVSPLLVYAIAVQCWMLDVGCWITNAQNRKSEIGNRKSTWPVLAAAIYSLSASGFMTTWWNFSTHIFSQWAHLLLLTALVLWWNSEFRNQGSGIRDQGVTLDRRSSFVVRRSSAIVVLFALQLLVYLGHFGFWINTTLLGGLGLLALVVRRRWDAKAQIVVTSFIAAEIATAVFFYSGYTGLFIAQAQATAAGGLNGLAGREAAPLGVLWDTLWDAGLRVHFGFFPVPLALAGFMLLRRSKEQGARSKEQGARSKEQGAKNSSALSPQPSALSPQPSALSPQPSALAVLIGGTFLIALVFAALPFLSGSTLSTRWLMFSAWCIAVAAALAMHALWRCGRAGQIIVVTMCSYVLWVMASQWLVAMIWRVRPPEPF